VNIYRLELLSWEPPHARIFVHCSSGTYIRSLARDIALAAGSCAYLKALVRTNIGGFSINNEQLTMKNEQLAMSNVFLHPINKNIFEKLNIPCIEIPSDIVKNVINGKPLEQILRNIPAFSAESGNTVALFSGDNLIAVIETSLPNKWNYGYVYASN